MTSTTRCINRFYGRRGYLLKADEKITELTDVTIEENVEYIRSPDSVDVPYRSWISVSFFNIGQNFTIFKDMVSDTNTVTKYTITSVGRLDDGTSKVAEVFGVYLTSSTSGRGDEVTFSNPPTA